LGKNVYMTHHSLGESPLLAYLPWANTCSRITSQKINFNFSGNLKSGYGFITATDPGYDVNIYNNFFHYTLPGPAGAVV